MQLMRSVRARRLRATAWPGARRAPAATGLLVAGLGAACGASPAPLPRAQNLVLISIDTLRADHLGCYGNQVVQTPHIDALAAEGVLFASHMSAAPSTLCSHTSLMTGTYPHTHGTPRNGFEIPEGNLMLAEVLAERGFDTAAVLGAFPLRAKFHFDQGFAHYDDRDAKRDGAQVNRGVQSWLEQRGADAGRFFLFVHYWDAHYPYDPPAPYDRMYRSDGTTLERTKPEIEEVRANLYAGLDESARSTALRGLYAGGVSYVDSHVGALMELLGEAGALEETLVVLTADHGEAMDEHWEYWDHGESTYETSVHTPLILRLPGGEQAGTRPLAPLSNVDVMPTLLDLLAIPTPGRVEGTSVVPHILTPEPAATWPVYAEGTKPHTETLESATWTNGQKCRTVRRGQWKLIHRPAAGSYELYDLEADPGERSNLLAAGSDPAEWPELPRELATLLETWSARVPARTGVHDTSTETLQQLEALGYVENQ